MTLDGLAIIVCTAQGYRREDVKISDIDAARAVLLAVADWHDAVGLTHHIGAQKYDSEPLRIMSGERQKAADELRRIAGEGS